MIPLRRLFLPSVAAGGALVLLVPLRSTSAFTKRGESLDETQRDVRMFDNFADATANDNTTPDAQFPGRTGAELALWKAVVEWGSTLHGDGTGDPAGANLLGSGGANFDAFWAGNASGPGGTNDNIVSALVCGGAGTLAFAEFPTSDGWRLRVCDDWVWNDGPGVPGPMQFDLQSVLTSVYGLTLGLGHSLASGATMAPSLAPGQVGVRSIEADDRAGIQCLYGVASATKPRIDASVASAGTLTLFGANFAASDNEVWFTAAADSDPALDPIVRVTGLAAQANGKRLTLAIPPEAGPGDVLVKLPGSGGATLSNAFPSDLAGSFGSPGPRLASVSPAAVPALIPGTGETVTLTGSNLDLVTSVLLDGLPLAMSHTIVDADTLTLDMPQTTTLGLHQLGVSDGTNSHAIDVAVEAATAPVLELGDGELLNVVDRDDGLRLRLAGPVGSIQRLYGSPSDVPSANAFVSLALGNQFTELIKGGAYVIPAAGWLELNLPSSALPVPPPAGLTLHAQTLELVFPAPLPVSNLQSIVLVP